MSLVYLWVTQEPKAHISERTTMTCRTGQWLLMCLLACLAVSTAFAQGTSSKTSNSAGVYPLAQRTQMHVQAGTVGADGQKIFNDTVTNILDYLKQNNVVLVEDPERGMIRTETTMSTESMANLAKGAGAVGVLLITIDRPVMACLKVTVQAIDLSGNTLWQESAQDASGLNANGAVKKTQQKIEAKLKSHIGGPGLPTIN